MISCLSLTRLPHLQSYLLPPLELPLVRILLETFHCCVRRIMKETEIRNAIVFKTILIKDMQITVMVMCLSIKYLVR